MQDATLYAEVQNFYAEQVRLQDTNDVERFAATFTQDAPVAMVENDCVIATGSSSINAFDRLEVAEYSARAVVACRNIGAVVMIDDAQAAEIDRAFKPQ